MLLQKSYIVFDLGSRTCAHVKSTRGLCNASDGSILGNKNGVVFKFNASRVVVVGSVGDGGALSRADVDQTVSSVTGFPVCGKIVVQVYHMLLPEVRSKVQQALLQHRLAANPPRGLLSSTLDYQVSEKLVLKLSPFKDGFMLNVRIDCRGFAEIMCDARVCKHALSSDVFHRRCISVIQMIQTVKGTDRGAVG